MGVILLLNACEKQRCGGAAYEQQEPGCGGSENADINYTLGGHAKAKLLSPLMLRIQDASPYVEFPKTLHVDFSMKQVRSIAGSTPAMENTSKPKAKVFLKDSVVVINVLGDTLYCQELWWDRNRKGSGFTDKPVRIRRKLQIIDGTGMEARQDFKEWVIRNVTHSYIRVPNSEFPAD